jgi:putative holliday junction resolvase
MRIMGVDVGERRIGIAISDPTATLARPVRTIAGSRAVEESARALRAEVDAFVREDEGLGLVVMGLPRRLDGTPNEQTARVLAIAEALRARIAIPVAFEDERLSSREAESRLALRERDWRKRKAKLDAAAAAVILQDYLDRHV